MGMRTVRTSITPMDNIAPDLAMLEDDIPLGCVSLQTRTALSKRLDVTQLLLGPHGYRDWRGLAAMAGFSRDSVELMTTRADSPTEVLLDEWSAQNREPKATLGLLLRYLELLERFDIIDDVKPNLDTQHRDILHKDL